MSAATAVTAQNSATTPPPKLSLSLEDCIRMALKDNLTLQVGDRVALGETADLDVRSGGRLGVLESQLTVDGAYGYYDPQLSIAAGENYRKRPGGYDPSFGVALSESEQWQEEVSLSLDGILPTGTRYTLGGELNRLTGSSFLPLGNITTPIPEQHRTDVGVTITQPLLRDFWIDAGRLNIKLRKQDLKTSEHAFRLLTMDIIQRVALAYYDLIAARDQVKTQEKALELAQQLVAENKKKVEVGTLAPLEERQAESQAATAKATLTAAQFGDKDAENVLKALISHDFASIQPIQIEPTEKLVPVYQSLNVHESWRVGLENRPDYQIAKEEVESRKIVLQYRKNQLYPALDLQGTYGRNGLGGSAGDSFETIGDDRYPYFGGGVVLTFPFTFKSDRANYKQGKIQQEAAVLRLKRVEDFVLQEIDSAIKRANSAYEATESARAARKFAEEALEAEVKKLEAGRSTSFVVLQLQRDLTAARALEIQAASEYNKSLHQVYFREGSTLQRNKINLEIK